MRAVSRLGRLAILLQLIAMVSLLGCSTVTLQQPIGAPIPTEEQRRLAGVWLINSDEPPIHVAFANDQVGLLSRAEWQAGVFRLQRGELHLAAAGEMRILSLQIREDGKPAQHVLFARYAFTDADDLVIWLPKVALFEAAVAGNRIGGEVLREKHETHVVLSAQPRAILDFLATTAEPFDLERPLVLRRIARIAHGHPDAKK